MFVLGVGAQKSGTSWLFSQLRKAPNFSPVGAKELHYWDKAYSQLDYEIHGENDVQKWFKAQHPSECGRPRLVEGTDYFRRIERALRRSYWSRRPAPLVADVTPAYSGLPLFAWRKIASELSTRQIDYRIVYFLRDPVDRIVSAINAGFGGKVTESEKEAAGGEKLRSIARERAASWYYQARTRYELTLANLENAFPEDRLFVGFNELIQSADQLGQLQDFLGFDLSYFDLQEKVNVRGKALHLDFETKKEIANFYSPTYLAMLERYPFLPSVWPGYELLNPITSG